MLFADIFTDIGALHDQNPTVFFTVIIGVVLFSALIASLVVIRKTNLRRADGLYYAVAQMNEVQRREDAREAEKQRKISEADEPAIEVVESDPEGEAKIDENTGNNGESEQIVEAESVGETEGENGAESEGTDVPEEGVNE